MATNPNLPAGFFITTIGRQRCTAVPRALTTLTGDLATAAAARPPTTASAEVAVSTSLAAAPAPVAPTSIASPVAQPGIADIIWSFTTSTAPSAAAPSNLAASEVASTAIPTPNLPITTPGPHVAVAVAPSQTITSRTAATIDNDRVSSTTLSQTSSAPTLLSTSTPKPKELSAAPGMSSQPQISAGLVVGIVLGALGLLASIALLLWYLKKAKRRRLRESLLTPLDSGTRTSLYDADAASTRPMRQGSNRRTALGHSTDRARNVGSNFWAGISAAGASLKSRVIIDRSDHPIVNLDRSNSQFLHGPIPQHSRNNSGVTATAHTILKENVSDWRARLGECTIFGWRQKSEPANHFTAARDTSEKLANKHPSYFSTLLGKMDREIQALTEQRRASPIGQSNLPRQVGSLGLRSGNDNPLADPTPSLTTPAAGESARDSTDTNLFAHPGSRFDPFAGPISQPNPTARSSNTSIADIRLSRGQSIDATSTDRACSPAGHSHYPSSPAPSQDSYSDTVFSPLSTNTNARKGKDRSGNFDLERPDLWRPKELSARNLRSELRNKQASAYYQGQARISGVGSHAWKYRSGGSLLSIWGDLGQDLGPASMSSSLRADASSREGSIDLRHSFPDGRAVHGSLHGEFDEREIGGLKRSTSTESKATSKGDEEKTV